MKSRLLFPLLTLTTMATALWTASCSAQEYIEISAEITQTNTVQLGTATPYWTFPVTCSIWGNQWRIDSRYVKNGIQAAYYDGTNVYSSLGILPSNGTNSQGGSGAVTVTILPSPGGHPLGNLGLNIPWLAFCSGKYLKMPNRTIPVPVIDVPGNADSLSFVDKTTTFDDAEGLPKTIELLTSKEHYLSSLDDERLFRNSRLQNARLTRSFYLPDGLVRFRYTVEASTNFNGRSYPTLFRYFDYRSVNNSSTFSLVNEGVGRLTSIRRIAAAPPGNVFSTNALQTVIDGRFRQPDKALDAINYAWPKEEVPAVDNPVLQARLKDMLRGASTVKHAERTQWLRLCLYAGCAVPLGLILFVSRKPKSTNN